MNCRRGQSYCAGNITAPEQSAVVMPLPFSPLFSPLLHELFGCDDYQIAVKFKVVTGAPQRIALFFFPPFFSNTAGVR